MNTNLHSTSPSVNSGMLGIPNRQFIIYVILGVVFWFSAAMVARFLGGYGLLDNGGYRAIIYFMTFPLAFVFIELTKAITKVGNNRILLPMVIMTSVAAFSDGVALAWFHELYAETFETSLYAAATILWGAGAGQMLAFYLEQKSRKTAA